MFKPDTDNSDVMTVFDLDGTLTAVTSVESAFLKYLLRKAKIKPVHFVEMLIHYLKNIWEDPVEAKKRNKMYLKNVPKEDVKKWVKDFIKTRGNTLLIPEMVDLVSTHKRQGQKIILITGSPDILVNMLSVKALFDHIYTTELEVLKDRYTGRINGLHYYGRIKADLVRRIANELEVNLQKSFCYADSEEDIEMMSLFGHPVATYPDKQLREFAEKRNWEILQ